MGAIGMRLFLLLTLPLYALDQLTKWLVLRRLEHGDGFPVIDGFFNLVHVRNTGAAFGSFSDSNSFFIGLSAVTLGVLAVCAWRRLFTEPLTQIGVALLASGVLGNLTDRIAHGHVIDFLDFHLGEHHWPAFNVADSCICIAAGLFVLGSFFERKAPAEAPSSSSSG